jgi:hypothetical protein
MSSNLVAKVERTVVVVVAVVVAAAVAVAVVVAVTTAAVATAAASEVQNKVIIMEHQISSCHVLVVRSFFIL